MEKVTLGEELFLVTRTNGIARNNIIAHIVSEIENHREREILTELLRNAILGDTKVLLGNMFPPVELASEKIKFENNGHGVIANFNIS